VSAAPAVRATPDAGIARIGPNAILQVADALRDACGAARTRQLFEAADLAAYLSEPPTGMVDEREVMRLHRVLRAELPPAELRGVVRAAGTTTGDYLLAHRIPRAAQRLLAVLPPSLASRGLLAAIRRHAWTFAGSGTFTDRPGDRGAGRPVEVAIADCPLCRGAHAAAPICDYYAATFERLYRVLVAPGAIVVETACCARGDDACRFSIAW
jgi:divinyl protochlorophyllide a 8-vinyl-reductase